MAQSKYHIGDTLILVSGYTVVIRKIVTKHLLRVSYGFDTQGNDIISLIDITKHI